MNETVQTVNEPALLVEERRLPLPPFTEETALIKVQLAEDAWNTRDPRRVALAYTVDSEWRNRIEFVHGREAIVALLTRKWQNEHDTGCASRFGLSPATVSRCASNMSGMTTPGNGIAATAMRTGSSHQTA